MDILTCCQDILNSYHKPWDILLTRKEMECKKKVSKEMTFLLYKLVYVGGIEMKVLRNEGNRYVTFLHN